MSRGARPRDLRQRPLARPPRIVVIGLALLAVGAAVLMPRGDAARRPPGAVVLEYGNFNRSTVNELVDLADRDLDSIPGLVRDGRSRPTIDRPRQSRSIEEIATGLGPEAAATLVAAIFERGRRRNPQLSSWRAPNADAGRHPLGMALVARSDAASDDALFRALTHHGVHAEAKVEALVALCRKADAVADRNRIALLASFVTNTSADGAIRHQAILRLDRLGVPLSPAFEVALDDRSAEIAQPLATVLSLCGEIVSIELLIAEIAGTRRPGAMNGERGLSALRALRKHPEFPPSLEPTIEAFVTFAKNPEYYRGENPERTRGEAATAELCEALTSWAAALPDAAVPLWDRDTRAMRRSPERRRSLALTTDDGMVAADDADIDVAGATLCALYGPDAAAQTLDRLDRLARRLRPAVDAAPTPLAKLEAIQDACVPRHQMLRAGLDHSSLAVVLETRGAICMGWTMLFVALGDRLGLPIRAVHVPGHIFVRWDDGIARLNFDPAGGGVVRSDAEYAAEYNGPDNPLHAARDLRPLSRRELVSLALSNSAAWALTVDAPTFARRLADLSARLDPANSAAWINGLAAIATDGPSLADEVREHLRRAPPVRAAVEARMAAWRLRWAGLGDEALRMLDVARALNPAHAEAPSLRAAALAGAGRFSEARDAARAGLTREGGDATECEIVLLALDIAESPPPPRLPEGRLTAMLEAAALRSPSGSQSPAGAWRWNRGTVSVEQEMAASLCHLLLTIPPRTPDRAHLAIEVLGAARRAENRRLAASGAPREPSWGGHRHEALRRYAEARAAEATPSANPGAPGGDK